MTEETNLTEHADAQVKLRLAGQGRRAAAAPVPQAAPEPVLTIQEPHLLDHVKVLYKRRWTAATAFLLVLVAVIVQTFTATPVFEAKTRLLIESDERNVVSFKQVVDEDQTKQDYYQTQYNILQSRVLARKTIDSLKLWNSPHFGGPSETKRVGARTTLGGAVSYVTSTLGGTDAAPAGHALPAADETTAESGSIDAFLGNLTVAPVGNSRLVDIKYQLTDPTLATLIVNALAKKYIEQNLEYKFVASKEASDWLGERLVEQRTLVEVAESKLQRYREQNDAISLEDRQNIVVQKLADLNGAVTRAKTERIQKEAMHDQLRAIQTNSAALDTYPAILSNSFIQQQKADLSQLQQQQAQLSDKFGEKHPEILKNRSAIQSGQLKLQAEVNKIVQSVRTEYQAALAQENSLAHALAQQKGEALSMNRKGIEYSVLNREVESSKQMYESLLQRAKETTVAGELKTSNIRVLDRAERPRTPITPRTRLNLLRGLVGGAVLAFTLAFFFEYIDSHMKTPDEIRTHLGLSSLGMVPALDAKSWKGEQPIISSGVPPRFAEAFRVVRTNVLFSSAAEGSRTLVITSTGLGEGKTTVAANLAIGLAQADQRVLLIDADMRRPRVHELFGQKQEPGLSNVIVGNAKASESVRKTTVPGLWVLTAGHTPPNPAELLGSQRFREFLTSLKEHFDWVLLDTPPVMAVTDAVIASNLVSGVVFVVGAEMTSRHAARSAMEQLAHGRAHFVGAVLNRVELDKNSYYYSQYYRSEYGAYHQQAVGSR